MPTLFEYAKQETIDRYEAGWDFLSAFQKQNAVAMRVMEKLKAIANLADPDDFRAEFINTYHELQDEDWSD